MKKKIVILGSTGSIGKTTLNIIKKNKKDFEIELLTANNNINELLKQVKEFNVKNLIVSNKKKFLFLKNKLKKKNIKIYDNLDCINIILKKKLITVCVQYREYLVSNLLWT